MPAPELTCDGTQRPLVLALGVMSSPGHVAQRTALRVTWGTIARRASILPCFVVGHAVKRTPRAPWDKRRTKELNEPDGGPHGELTPNPALDDLASEHAQHGDVLVLPGSAEIQQGGTSGLKTLPWWRHAAEKLPGASWVGKCDDDTWVNVPRLLARLSPVLTRPPPRALLGSIVWGCYSDARFKWEASYKHWSCGRTEFARSRAPGEPANMSLTYEGPYELALGWFFVMPRSLGRLLAQCQYADAFHTRALHATREPFLRKEDDPLNGFWLYKCLREAGQPPVAPLPSLGRDEAHNMACVSAKGLYRRPI